MHTIKRLMPAVLLLTIWPGLVAGSARSPRAQASEPDPVLAELKTIRALLERVLAARPIVPASPESAAPDEIVTVSIGDGRVMGRADAPLTIVEYTDLECDFCVQFHRNTFPELRKQYIETGQAKYVTVDFPLEDKHPLARLAAVACRCAGEQGRFWEMRDAIFGRAGPLTKELFGELAGSLRLDHEVFQKCIRDPSTYKAELARDRDGALAMRVNATPTLVVGKSGRQTVTGVKLVGAWQFAALDQRLRMLLEPAPPR